MKSSKEKPAKFEYRRPKKEALKKRATQKGGMYDTPYLPEFSVVSLKEGDHRLRIMPATYDGAEHYGLDVWVHSGIGADGQTYLCRQKMKGEDCCLCKEQARAAREGDDEYAGQIKPYRRVLVWAIDRDEEEAGPQLWPMAWGMDKDITTRAIDKESGDILYIDHPEEGYDVTFTREGSGKKTKYVGTTIVRRSTPLADDEKTMEKWLQFIADHPLDGVLNWYDEDYIEKVFAGAAKPKDDEDEEEKPKKKGKGKYDDEEEEKPKKKARDEDDDDDEDDEEEEKPKKKGKKKAEADDEDDDD